MATRRLRPSSGHRRGADERFRPAHTGGAGLEMRACGAERGNSPGAAGHLQGRQRGNHVNRVALVIAFRLS
jgi:hypothetical protein